MLQAVRRRLLRVATVVAFAAAVPPGVPASASAQDALAFAQERYARGIAHFDAREYERSLEEFRASMQLYSSPNTRLYVARSLRELGRLTDALFEMEQTLREATERAAVEPRYTATRDAASEELRALQARVGRVRLRLRGVPEDATVTVGGRAIPPPARELAIPVLPGRVTIVVHAAGFEREELGVEVGAGRTIDVPIALRRPAPSAPPARAAPRERERGDRTVDSSPLRTTSIGLLVGAGAVALASGVLFLITGLQHGDLEACNDDLACAPSSMREDIADRGRALETASWITLGVAAVVAAAGATTLFLSRSRVGATEGREVAARAPLDLETSPDRVVLVARGALP